jgi:hypothetical protein
VLADEEVAVDVWWQALAVSKETYIRINREGIMCVQHQVSSCAAARYRVRVDAPHVSALLPTETIAPRVCRHIVCLPALQQIETSKGGETFLDFLMVAEEVFEEAGSAHEESQE